ncbi:ABC transporter permease [Mycolicibacterium setense]|uniref:ABC transporter permease n=2 Tax=Mycolicibacterium setense TaxID=431269 RepID=A0ABR4Z111_9MYCO|nr:ABC transporter permease [Mycolicibacterium setense]
MDPTARRMTWRRVRLLLPVAAVFVVIAVGWLVAPDVHGQGSGIPFAQPSAQHWLGTDSRSEDVLAKLAQGGWVLALVAALIAVVVTGLASMLGALVALRPRLAWPLAWLADAMLLVPPVLLILLVLVSWPSGGVWALVALAVVGGTPYTTRVMSAAASPIAASGYVQVADASGERLPYLIFGQVLPNMGQTVATQLGLRYVEAIYVVSTAAFLQLIPSVGSANWAMMVRENAAGLLLNPAAVVAPAAAIAVLAVVVNVTALGSSSPLGDRS